MNILSFVAGPENNQKVGGIAYIDKLAGSVHFSHSENNVLLIVCGTPPADQSGRIQNKAFQEKGAFFKGFQILSFPSKGKNGISVRFLLSLPAILNAKIDFITLHSIYTFPVVIGYFIARFKKIPYAIWPHGVFSPYQRSISTTRKGLFDWFFTRQILQNASAVVFTAKGERKEFHNVGIPVSSVIIPHGIDLKKYEKLSRTGKFRSRYFGDYSGPIVLFLSRINSKKGLDILLPALQKLHNKKLEFRAAIVGAGDPPEYELKVRKWIDNYHLNNIVILPGPIYGDEKFFAFTDSDLFVLPSRSENFGYAVFEAMAAKLPVVISDQINYASEIKESLAGLCVELDVDQVCGSIEKVISDKNLRAKLAENGYRFVSKFPWESTGEKINQMIISILEHHAFPEELFPEEL